MSHSSSQSILIYLTSRSLELDLRSESFRSTEATARDYEQTKVLLPLPRTLLERLLARLRATISEQVLSLETKLLTLVVPQPSPLLLLVPLESEKIISNRPLALEAPSLDNLRLIETCSLRTVESPWVRTLKLVPVLVLFLRLKGELEVADLQEPAVASKLRVGFHISKS